MISSSEEKAKYCIVSDIDVEPMPPHQIFDQLILGYLSINGYVFNRVSLAGNFENSFFIFNKEREDLQNIHKKTLIERTSSIITLLRREPIDTCFRSEYTLDTQFVFRQYHQFQKNERAL
jgi:hypothetical protein